MRRSRVEGLNQARQGIKSMSIWLFSKYLIDGCSEETEIIQWKASLLNFHLTHSVIRVERELSLVCSGVLGLSAIGLAAFLQPELNTVCVGIIFWQATLKSFYSPGNRVQDQTQLSQTLENRRKLNECQIGKNVRMIFYVFLYFFYLLLYKKKKIEIVFW